jgi:hypothetical protein
MPRRVLAVLSGIARRGAAGRSHFARRTGMSFLANSDKNDGVQEASGIRVAFSLDTFFCGLCSCIFRIHHVLWFGEAKESVSSVGTRTHIQITVALATPHSPLTLTLSHKG